VAQPEFIFGGRGYKEVYKGTQFVTDIAHSWIKTMNLPQISGGATAPNPPDCATVLKYNLYKVY